MTIILTISDQNWSNRSSADPDEAVGQAALGSKKALYTAIGQTAFGQTAIGQKDICPTVIVQTAVGQTDLAKKLQGKHLLFQRPLFE